MWKKLYSNSGLILLAILAAGVWYSNLQTHLQPKTTPPIDAVASPSQPQGLTAEDRRRIFFAEQAAKQAQASPSPTVSLVEIEQRTKELELELERSKTAVDEFVRQRRSGATAICADGTYSYSASRRGTCSHHGGVAQWLR